MQRNLFIKEVRVVQHGRTLHQISEIFKISEIFSVAAIYKKEHPKNLGDPLGVLILLGTN